MHSGWRIIILPRFRPACVCLRRQVVFRVWFVRARATGGLSSQQLVKLMIVGLFLVRLFLTLFLEKMPLSSNVLWKHFARESFAWQSFRQNLVRLAPLLRRSKNRVFCVSSIVGACVDFLTKTFMQQRPQVLLLLKNLCLLKVNHMRLPLLPILLIEVKAK